MPNLFKAPRGFYCLFDKIPAPVPASSSALLTTFLLSRWPKVIPTAGVGTAPAQDSLSSGAQTPDLVGGSRPPLIYATCQTCPFQLCVCLPSPTPNTLCSAGPAFWVLKKVSMNMRQTTKTTGPRGLPEVQG